MILKVAFKFEGIAVTTIRMQDNGIAGSETPFPTHAFGNEYRFARSLTATMKPQVKPVFRLASGAVGIGDHETIRLHGSINA